jgi:hypothetical protein
MSGKSSKLTVDLLGARRQRESRQHGVYASLRFSGNLGGARPNSSGAPGSNSLSLGAFASASNTSTFLELGDGRTMRAGILASQQRRSQTGACGIKWGSGHCEIPTMRRLGARRTRAPLAISHHKLRKRTRPFGAANVSTKRKNADLGRGG